MNEHYELWIITGLFFYWSAVHSSFIYLLNQFNMSPWASSALFTPHSSSTLYLTVHPWATPGNIFTKQSICRYKSQTQWDFVCRIFIGQPNSNLSNLPQILQIRFLRNVPIVQVGKHHRSQLPIWQLESWPLKNQSWVGNIWYRKMGNMILTIDLIVSDATRMQHHCSLNVIGACQVNNHLPWQMESSQIFTCERSFNSIEHDWELLTSPAKACSPYGWHPFASQGSNYCLGILTSFILKGILNLKFMSFVNINFRDRILSYISKLQTVPWAAIHTCRSKLGLLRSTGSP